jgi:archaellum component FlaC
MTKETSKQSNNNSEIRKELAELKLTVEIVRKQVEKLANVLNVVQPIQPMYTEDEYREIAEYRRRQK